MTVRFKFRNILVTTLFLLLGSFAAILNLCLFFYSYLVKFAYLFYDEELTQKGELFPKLSGENGTQNVTIIAVHGTGSRGAEWVEATSNLAVKIQSNFDSRGIKVDWYKFEWSGANTVSGRRAAAERLTRELDNAFKMNSTQQIVMVGHSHGGNIALKAFEQFCHIPSLRLITLATPFLSARRRPSTRLFAVAFPFINIAGATIIVGLLANASLDFGSGDHGHLTAIAIGLVICVVSPALIPKMQRAIESDEAELLGASPDISRIEPARDRILICSSAGDEADGGLKLASLINGWISRLIRGTVIFKGWEPIYHNVFPIVESGQTTTPTAQLPPIASVVNFAPAVELYKNRNAVPLDFIKAWSGIMLLELFHRAIGTSTATAAATIIVTSSETPAGNWIHYQTLPSIEDNSTLLSHSQIYTDLKTLDTIVSWLSKSAISHA